MQTDPKLLEEQAHQFLSQGKLEESSKGFKLAAEGYRSQGRHKQAAVCFAAAAGCSGKECGESAFYRAALAYQEAARQSELSGDFEYASLLYKYAAINYEKDGEFLNFSECFYRSREAQRKFSTYLLISPKKIHHIAQGEGHRGVKARLKHLITAVTLTLACLVWGHGERPWRAFFCAIAMVILCAVFYAWTDLNVGGVISRPGFLNALYFSTTTFTTVGYGDIVAVGPAKAMVMLEAFCGIFMMPLFIVSLSRKYMRL